MTKSLKVPEGYEEYKQEFLKKLRKGEILDLEDSKKKNLTYVV